MYDKKIQTTVWGKGRNIYLEFYVYAGFNVHQMMHDPYWLIEMWCNYDLAREISHAGLS